MMLRSAKSSLAIRKTSSQFHFCLPISSVAPAAIPAFGATNQAYSNARGQSTSAPGQSPTPQLFNVNSEDVVQPSTNTRPGETHDSLTGKTGSESSNGGSPKNIQGVASVDRSVEGHVAKTIKLLSPHVKARSIRNQQAFLDRINAQRKKWPLSD